MIEPIKNSSKVVICFGDSGVGKSSFIDCFALNQDKCQVKTTEKLENYSIVKIFDSDIGYLDFIDIKGTNNPEDSEDFDAFDVFSHIQKSYKEIDAVLYFHDSNQRARFYAEIRLALIQKYMKNFNVSLNSILICTKYSDLNKKNQVSFESFVSKHKGKFSNMVIWDNVEMIPDQFTSFKNALKTVKPFILSSNNINNLDEKAASHHFQNNQKNKDQEIEIEDEKMKENNLNGQKFASHISSNFEELHDESDGLNKRDDTTKQQENNIQKIKIIENTGNVLKNNEKISKNSEEICDESEDINERDEKIQENNIKKNKIIENTENEEILKNEDSPSKNNSFSYFPTNNEEISNNFEEKRDEPEDNNKIKSFLVVKKGQKTIKMKGNRVSYNLFNYNKNDTQEESFLIVPDYPNRVSEKKIDNIAVCQIKADENIKWEYKINGDGEPTGKVLVKMIYPIFGQNSEIELKIDYSFSYKQSE